MDHLDRVFAAIDAAQETGLAVVPPPGVLTGFSAEKFLGLLQRLGGLGGAYLEIGVFQGMTLLSTAFANPTVPCYGIDNFAYHDPDGTNERIVRQRAEALGLSNWHILNMDFEVALDRIDELVPEPVGLYLIDGPHDYRAQLICLGFAADKVAPGGVVVVDDANYRHVRQATADFLKMRPDFKLIFESYTAKHPHNMSKAEEAEARGGWWDGIHVLVRDVDDQIEGLVPPTENRQYVVDHEVHAHAYGPLALHATNLLYGLTHPRRLPGAIARLLKEGKAQLKGWDPSYVGLNTWSDGLPSRTAGYRATASRPRLAPAKVDG